MKNIMISSILAAIACFGMVSQASAAPAPHFEKHQVSHAQQHKAPQKVVDRNHKHAPEKGVDKNQKHAPEKGVDKNHKHAPQKGIDRNHR